MDATGADIGPGELRRGQIRSVTDDSNIIAIYKVGDSPRVGTPAAVLGTPVRTGAAAGFNGNPNIIRVDIQNKRAEVSLDITHLLIQVGDNDILDSSSSTTDQLRAAATNRNNIEHDLMIPVTQVWDVSSITARASIGRASVYKINFGNTDIYDIRVQWDFGSNSTRVMLTSSTTSRAAGGDGKFIIFRAIRGING